MGEYADCADADVVVSRRFVQQRLIPAFMEPRSVVVDPTGEQLTMWTATQIPHIVRFALAATTGVPESKIRVIAPDVGGGFGGKLQVTPEEWLAWWVARQLGRPVKYTETRSESLLSAHHGRDQWQKLTLAADKDGTVTVDFAVDTNLALTEGTTAAVKYENLIGDRYLALEEGAGSVHRLTPGETIPKERTSPALDVDALIGGFRPLFRALDPDQVNALSGELLKVFQGQGGTISSVLAQTSALTTTLAGRDQLIGQVITNLNTVLATVDDKGAQFNASVDELQKLVTGLAEGRDPIAGAIGPLASAENDLTEMLEASRRPLQGVLENARPFLERADTRKADINKVIEPLAENYLRLNALGAYGSFFNIYYCSIRMKINGPAGSDILIPFGGPPDPTKGRCSENG